jgi:transposase-like protein
MKTPLKADELNLVTLAKEYSDADKARGLLEALRWPGGPVCPHCEHNEVYSIKAKQNSKQPARKGLYCCAACRKQFTVTVGTIFEDSHLPISKWLMALFILCSSKKSVSAHQLHRMLDVTYKTAWFMAHRIRFAMGSGPNNDKLTGTVECDETFVGGKPRPGSSREPKPKTPVVALVERGGEVRTRVVASVTQKNLGKCLNECVSKTAVINTDQAGVYIGLLKGWKRHDTVNHSACEYSRQNEDGTKSGVNHAESFFSLLKRGIFGAWHHVSPEHLAKYSDEVAFRWNSRKTTDGERMAKAVAATKGKRLTYRHVI